MLVVKTAGRDACRYPCRWVYLEPQRGGEFETDRSLEQADPPRHRLPHGAAEVAVRVAQRDTLVLGDDFLPVHQVADDEIELDLLASSDPWPRLQSQRVAERARDF